MREQRTFSGQYARKQLVKDIFKDVADTNARDCEVLIVELQQIARDAARNERLRAMR